MLTKLFLIISLGLGPLLPQVHGKVVPSSAPTHDLTTHLVARVPVPDFTVTLVLEDEERVADEADYQTFLQELRNNAPEPGLQAHGVPMLPPQDDVDTRYFEVVLRTLTNSLVLRFRRDTLYLIGYSTEGSGVWYEFKMFDSSVHLIPGSRQLGFDGSYGRMEAQGTGDRENIPLGWHPLVSAVHTLTQTATTSSADKATALLVVIQMIAEAARLAPIADFIANRWFEGAGLGRNLILFETTWGTLSERVRRTPANRPGDYANATLPASLTNLQLTDLNLATAALSLCQSPMVNGRQNRANGKSLLLAQGRPLVEVLWVRVINIDGEDPGDLYGTIKAIDGSGEQYLLNRDRSNYQSVSPWQNITLDRLPRSITANDGFSIQLDLKDKDADLSPDDEIAKGAIYPWNHHDPTEPWDRIVGDQVFGEYGTVDLRYIVMRDAASASIDIVMINGDGENPANVYGTITAQTSWGVAHLLNTNSGSTTDVRPGNSVPLAKSAVAIPMGTTINLNAKLWDYDSLSSDDEIANGNAVLTPMLQQSTETTIRGRYGEIRVRASWY